jgi:hypothetical protein
MARNAIGKRQPPYTQGRLPLRAAAGFTIQTTRAEASSSCSGKQRIPETRSHSDLQTIGAIRPAFGYAPSSSPARVLGSSLRLTSDACIPQSLDHQLPPSTMTARSTSLKTSAQVSQAMFSAICRARTPAIGGSASRTFCSGVRLPLLPYL